MGAMRSWIIWLAALHYQGGRYLRFERRKYGSDQSWFKGSAPTECSTQRQAALVRCRLLASFHSLHIWYQRAEPYICINLLFWCWWVYILNRTSSIKLALVNVEGSFKAKVWIVVCCDPQKEKIFTWLLLSCWSLTYLLGWFVINSESQCKSVYV